MNIRTRDVQGFEAAIVGMRNPMDSWNLSDSKWLYHDDDSKVMYEIGEKDKELSIRLQKAGPEHCKHLRMVYAWADITAPRYWWSSASKHFTTSSVGYEQSC